MTKLCLTLDDFATRVLAESIKQLRKSGPINTKKTCLWCRDHMDPKGCCNLPEYPTPFQVHTLPDGATEYSDQKLQPFAIKPKQVFVIEEIDRHSRVALGLELSLNLMKMDDEHDLPYRIIEHLKVVAQAVCAAGNGYTHLVPWRIWNCASDSECVGIDEVNTEQLCTVKNVPYIATVLSKVHRHDEIKLPGTPPGYRSTESYLLIVPAVFIVSAIAHKLLVPTYIQAE
jgi:hypothetical protein